MDTETGKTARRQLEPAKAPVHPVLAFDRVEKSPLPFAIAAALYPLNEDNQKAEEQRDRKDQISEIGQEIDQFHCR